MFLFEKKLFFFFVLTRNLRQSNGSRTKRYNWRLSHDNVVVILKIFVGRRTEYGQWPG